MQAVARRTLLRYGPTRASLWAKVTGVVSRQMLASSFPPLMSERSEIVRGREFGDVNYLMQALFDLANPLSGDKELLPDTHHRDIPWSGA